MGNERYVVYCTENTTYIILLKWFGHQKCRIFWKELTAKVFELITSKCERHFIGKEERIGFLMLLLVFMNNFFFIFLNVSMHLFEYKNTRFLCEQLLSIHFFQRVRKKLLRDKIMFGRKTEFKSN